MRLVRLSHVNDPATACVYPGDPAPRLRTVATIEDDGFYLREVSSGEHTGTHWGAPGHFTPGAALADDLDVDDLYRPAVKIDVRERCAADPDYAVTSSDLREWEFRHGRIPAESVVVLWTGWDAKWGTGAYFGYDDGGSMHQPGFAPDAVRWLIETGRLGRRGGTGTDTFGPDRGIDPGYQVSRLVYREHRISLEVLANLAALPETGAHVLCGGQINRAGSGSPGIIYGLLPPG
ncbi:cyclase family protein [Actinoplanes sp. N902-109]|uniref:cyclase family protein n=1 Tax=Actinoplanes sp. (strain N902-109) TaxID=649831 RepID=UPI0003294EA1|nr:cyclase family protein [Actinoplanes sp. N902-109]AGL18343.1 cyclase family protein [Actinoplanes sp. N902-109]